MNIKFAATLLLSPLMVHAQANQPAQPQAANAPVLQSSLVTPTGLMLSSASSASTTTPGIRVSTGVVGPKLISSVPIQENTLSVKGLAKGDREAVVSMIVDETGRTTNLKIEQSAGADLDRSILEAVSQYRYRPATVSGQAAAIPLVLHVTVRN